MSLHFTRAYIHFIRNIYTKLLLLHIYTKLKYDVTQLTCTSFYKHLMLCIVRSKKIPYGQLFRLYPPSFLNLQALIMHLFTWYWRKFQGNFCVLEVCISSEQISCGTYNFFFLTKSNSLKSKIIKFLIHLI